MPSNRLKNEKRWLPRQYTKPKRKEATTVEYNLPVQAQKNQKDHNQQKGYKITIKPPKKTRQKRNSQFADFGSKNEASNNT